MIRPRYGLEDIVPPRGSSGQPEVERLLDRYGIAFVCAYPEILFPGEVHSRPGSPQMRLARMLEGYRILEEIYAPYPTDPGQSGGRSGGGR